MAARPFQLHARKEIVTTDLIERPTTTFASREAAEAEAALWERAGFQTSIVDVGELGTEPADDNDVIDVED